MTTKLTDIRHNKIEPYVAIPVKLLTDKKISADAIRIYGYILQQVFFRKTNWITMTNREWETLVGKSHDYVTKYLKELADARYITITITKSFWNNTWVNCRKVSLKGNRASIGF